MSFNTPILFLVFNRPDTTKRVFAKIREIQPKQLFIAADGAREDREGEKAKTEEVRKLILDNIDWDCEVKTLFRDENLGCGKAVSEGITWFFENVEQGIILEDDTLPDLSFFPFCEELLERYKEDDDIMSISGTNLLGKWREDEQSYFYSFGGIWGWASWKRAWKLYKFEIKDWDNPQIKLKIKNRFNSATWFGFYSNMFDSVNSGNLDTWDAQWLYAILINDKLTICTATNQVKNIGFNELGTHTNSPNEYIDQLKTFQIEFPLKHPSEKIYELKFEQKLSQVFFKRPLSLLEIPKIMLQFIKTLVQKIISKLI